MIQEFIQILDVLITLTASNPESTVLMREIITMAMRSIAKEQNKNLDYLTKLLLYTHVRKELLLQLNESSDEYIYWKEFDRVPNKPRDKICDPVSRFVPPRRVGVFVVRYIIRTVCNNVRSVL